MVDLPPEFVRLVQLYRELYSNVNTEGLNERDPLPGGEATTRCR